MPSTPVILHQTHFNMASMIEPAEVAWKEFTKERDLYLACPTNLKLKQQCHIAFRHYKRMVDFCTTQIYARPWWHDFGWRRFLIAEHQSRVNTGVKAGYNTLPTTI